MSAGTTKDNTSLVVRSCRQGGQGGRCGDNNHGALLQMVGLKHARATQPKPGADCENPALRRQPAQCQLDAIWQRMRK